MGQDYNKESFIFSRLLTREEIEEFLKHLAVSRNYRIQYEEKSFVDIDSNQPIIEKTNKELDGTILDEKRCPLLWFTVYDDLTGHYTRITLKSAGYDAEINRETIDNMKKEISDYFSK